MLKAGEFTATEALSILLTTESLLFAALSLTASLSAPGGRGARIPPRRGAILGGLAVLILALVALGASLAWFQIVQNNAPTGVAQCIIVYCILIAIISQPILAFLLLRGLRA